MNSIFIFLISYLFLLLLYIIFFYILGLKKNYILDSMQVKFLKIRHKINPKKLNPKKIGLLICFVDPFIISFTGTIVSLPKWNYIIEILLGFILLIGMIFSIYEIIGRLIKRKER